MVGIAFDPIKNIELTPNIYASSKIPKTIDIRNHGLGGSFPIQTCINSQSIHKLPFVLSIKLDDEDNPEIHTLVQKTGRVFYFTINNKNEKVFKYLGKSNETNEEKRAFLNVFLEANNGSLKAQAELAGMYADGKGVIQDIPEARRYYTLATRQASIEFKWCKYLVAEYKRPEDQYKLAIYLEKGIGTEKNLRQAVQYCKLAAKQNHQGAMFALATYYVDGQYGQQNYKAAADLIEKLIASHYGQTLTQERVINWASKLDAGIPNFFKKTVDRLIKDASIVDL